MDKGLFQDIAYFVVPLIIGLLVKTIVSYRNSRLQEQMPSAAELKMYVAKVTTLQMQGLNYSERLKYLEQIGLPKQAAEQILVEAEKKSS